MTIREKSSQIALPHAKMAPRLSIILCTYNRRNLLLSALASLRRQTLAYEQFEVIVVDNGSSDGTLEAVRIYVSAGMQPGRESQDLWYVHCLSERQNGLAHARHTALQAATGEIAVFLDDDTLADPYFLERLLAAYDESGADAVGGRVELRWEAPRPHWLSDDMLYLLGYFAPFATRTQLQEEMFFSSTSFSVSISALRSVGYFSPFLSKRQHLPANIEVDDLCQRLHQAGYALWYEPEAVVTHRVPAARLQRSYFMGRAYWQGRSEVLAEYANKVYNGETQSYRSVFQSVLPEMRELSYLLLLHRPLLRLAGRSTDERMLAAMAQARSWGHLRQKLQFLEHAPPEVTTPAVLFVRSAEDDSAADLLIHALSSQDVNCTQTVADIPLSWLWRHRTYQGQAMGIVHFYRAGALPLTGRQRQQLWFRLWLAQCWGLRIVTTDTGGWWQSTRSLRSLTQRALERQLFSISDIVLSSTRQPEQLYPDKKLCRRVRCLPHPGFRGYYAPPLPRQQAHWQLGLPEQAGFVYLCIAQHHTERELIHLLEAFREAQETALLAANTQLIVVGYAADKKISRRILKLGALNSTVYLCAMPLHREAIPLYLGAADALVLPHLSQQTAGMLETALLALSYGRTIVAPSLPRFNGMLPPSASILYDPTSRISLQQALQKVQTLRYGMNEKESQTFDAAKSWEHYGHRLRKLYIQLLNRP